MVALTFTPRLLLNFALLSFSLSNSCTTTQGIQATPPLGVVLPPSHSRQLTSHTAWHSAGGEVTSCDSWPAAAATQQLCPLLQLVPHRGQKHGS